MNIADIYIPGYTILNEVYTGREFILIHARKDSEGQDVFIKTTSSDFPGYLELNILRNEYNIGASLDGDYYPEYYPKIETGNRIFIPFSKKKGVNLRDFYHTNSPGIRDILEISISFCDVLIDLKKRHIVHKDIRPENIIFDPETKKIALVDFGISSTFGVEKNDYFNPGAIEGTLEFIAPEQTGKTNYPVDHRSDLYSFGCCLYWLLTGILPFQSEDPLELIHFHVARTPLPPHQLNGGIPAGLSAIVQKLMSKSPGDRYQTAKGLKTDLVHISEYFESLEGFVPGKKDGPRKFIIPEKLYGREKEHEAYYNAAASIEIGEKRILRISGEQGLGKSYMLDHLKNGFYQGSFVIASGLFVSSSSDISTSGIVSAIRKILNQKLSLDDKEFNFWKERIASFLGNNVSVLADLIPELRTIFGDVQDALNVEVADERDRFIYTFQQLVHALSGPGHPLIIFLEDVQRADPASLSLIESIITDADLNYFMLVMAQESGNDPVLFSPIAESIIEEIRLANLEPEIIESILGEITQSVTGTGKLAEIIFQRTLGKPSGVYEYIRLLQQRGIIVYNEGLGKWDIHFSSGDDLPLPESMLDNLSVAASSLDEGTRNVLSAAAVLGYSFSTEVLKKITGIHNTDLQNILRNATEAGFLIPFSPIKTIEYHHKGEILSSIDFRFLHDKIQQYFYNSISESERERLHFECGEFYLSVKSEVKNLIHEILNHFGASLKMLSASAIRKEFIELTFTGSKMAKNSGSYIQALKYVENAEKIIESSKGNDFKIAERELQFIKGELLFLNGNGSQAIEVLQDYKAGSTRLVEKMEASVLICAIFISTGNHENAISEGVGMINKLKIGKTIPSSPSSIRFSILFNIVRLKLQFSEKNMDKLLSMKRTENEEILKLSALYREILPAALNVNPDLFALIQLRLLFLTLKYGLSEFSAGAVMSYAIINSIVFRNFPFALKLSDLSFKLNQRLNEIHEKNGLLFAYHNFLVFLKGPLKNKLKDYLVIEQNLRADGNKNYAGYVASSYLWSKVCLGYNLDELENEFSHYLEKLKLNGETGVFDMVLPRYQFILALLGKTNKPDTLDDSLFSSEKHFKTLKETGSRSALAGLVLVETQLNCIFGNWQKALEIIQQGEAYIQNMEGVYFITDFYISAMLASSMNDLENGSKPEKSTIGKIKKYHGLLQKLHVQQPDNYGSHYYFSEGLMWLVKKDLNKSIEFLQKAAKISKEKGFNQNYAMANETLSRIFKQQGKTELANTSLLNARQGYLLWGAHSKVKKLDQYQLSGESNISIKEQDEVKQYQRSTTFYSKSDDMDLKSILKASSAIGEEIRFNNLVEKLTIILIENAGAERGVFVLIENQEMKMVSKGEMNENAFQCKVINEKPDDGQIPVSCINLVFRTKEPVLIDAASGDDKFKKDRYFQQNRVKSALCYPILHQGELIGIMYLENRVLANSFNAKRIQTLELLSGQIGISIKNSLLYENLEQKVIERTNKIELQKIELEKEKAKSDRLLLDILPEEIALELKETGKTKARKFDQVSIMFSDIVRFTQFSENSDPDKLVNSLDVYFSHCDKIVEKYGLEKIKTIGDAYLCVGGLIKQDNDIHEKVILAGLEMLDLVENLKNQDIHFDIRVGIHTGPIISGVVGTKKFVYDIWGDAVNIASRMESSGERGRLNISESTKKLVEGKFNFEFRGMIEAKNKGSLPMYFVSRNG